MNSVKNLSQIRENERISHTEIYEHYGLYEEGSWLKNPVKSVLDLFPIFLKHTHISILDLGCGVGRNSIAAARYFKDIDCRIDCVDILDVAIDKLRSYALTYGLSSSIHPILSSIENFSIKPGQYDIILGISALEHIDCEKNFISKLHEISNGLKSGGIVCLIMNSNIQEFSKTTGEEVSPQFELNLSTDALITYLGQNFSGCEVLKQTCVKQVYDIPRKEDTSKLLSNVVTFIAKK